jgi:hypothetical protein
MQGLTPIYELENSERTKHLYEPKPILRLSRVESFFFEQAPVYEERLNQHCFLVSTFHESERYLSEPTASLCEPTTALQEPKTYLYKPTTPFLLGNNICL